MFQSFPCRFVPAADGQPSSEKLQRAKGARVLVRLFCVALVAIAGVSSSAVAQTAEFSQGTRRNPPKPGSGLRSCDSPNDRSAFNSQNKKPVPFRCHWESSIGSVYLRIARSQA